MPNTETVRVTYAGATITMTWNGAQASAPILVDGGSIGRQTADARHRTALAVALAAASCWPEVEWPEVPAAGHIDMETWAAGCEAWDDLEYATAEVA